MPNIHFSIQLSAYGPGGGGGAGTSPRPTTSSTLRKGGGLVDLRARLTPSVAPPPGPPAGDTRLASEATFEMPPSALRPPVSAGRASSEVSQETVIPPSARRPPPRAGPTAGEEAEGHEGGGMCGCAWKEGEAGPMGISSSPGFQDCKDFRS